MNTDNENNAQAIIDAARAGAAPATLFEGEGFAKVYLPTTDGRGDIIHLNLEKPRDAPLRKRGIVAVFDAGSFNAILAANAEAGDITVYVDDNPEDPKIKAVLNGNGVNGPGWGDFTAFIEFRPTPQWKKWNGINGKLLDQAEFAEFIEDNLPDVTDPAGGEMLEIASYLQATKSVGFKSGIRLSSGQVQLQNLESIDAKVGVGRVNIPEVITLGISPIQGCPLYSVPARFRYRIVDGSLRLGIKLQRGEDLIASVIGDVVAAISLPEGAQLVRGRAPQATE